MQRIVGIGLGAVVAFVILWLYDATTFTDAIPAYAIAVAAGAIVSLVWPWVIGLRATRGASERHEDEIEREVQRQLAEKRD